MAFYISVKEKSVAEPRPSAAAGCGPGTAARGGFGPSGTAARPPAGRGTGLPADG